MTRLTTVIFVLALIFVGAGWMNSCEKAKRVESALHTSQEEAKIWKDKWGRSNAEAAVLQLDKENLRKHHNNVVDSLKKHGIKMRTVTRIETVNTVIRDTVPIYNSSWQDDWSFFEFDSTFFRYEIRDSLALVTHDKKYGFLNLKTKYVTRAIAFNPNTTLLGLTSSEIIPRERRLSVGLYAGYGATVSRDVVRVGPQIGVGLNYRIF